MKKIRFIALLMTMIVFCGALLSGCGQNEEQPQNETPSDSSAETEKVIGEVTSSSDYKIVVGENYSATEFYAASEIQSFAKQATGLEIEIVNDKGLTYNNSSEYISIGNTKVYQGANINYDMTSLNRQGYIIYTKGKSVFINAPSDRGMIYGAYEFIEQTLGVRFLTNKKTYVPKLNKVAIREMKLVEEPSFDNRMYYDYITAFSQDSTFNTRMRFYGEVTSGSEDLYGGAKEMSATIPFSHNLDFYVSPNTYRNSHPEWFVDKSGEWVQCLTNGITEDGEIDTSMSESVFTVALESLKNYVKSSDHNEKYFMVGQHDGYSRYCDCENCKKISAKYKNSGIYLRFVNLLAREINKWVKTQEDLKDREIILVMFAYQFTEDAPVVKNADGSYSPIDQTVVARDDVGIRIADFDANFYYSLTDPRQDLHYRTLMNSWQACAHKFSFWTYSLHEPGQYYFPTYHTYNALFAEEKSIGAFYNFIQGTHYEGVNWQQDMNCYIASKLMWDISVDAGEVLDEYVRLYYGDIAGPYVRELIRRFDERFAVIATDESFKMGYSGSTLTRGTENMPIELLEKQCELMDEAIEAVRASELSSTEKEDLIFELKKVKITPMTMILCKYTDYYGSTGKTAYAKEVISLYEELEIKNWGEGTSLAAYKAELGL